MSRDDLTTVKPATVCTVIFTILLAREESCLSYRFPLLFIAMILSLFWSKQLSPSEMVDSFGTACQHEDVDTIERLCPQFIFDRDSILSNKLSDLLGRKGEVLKSEKLRHIFIAIYTACVRLKVNIAYREAPRNLLQELIETSESGSDELRNLYNDTVSLFLEKGRIEDGFIEVHHTLAAGLPKQIRTLTSDSDYLKKFYLGVITLIFEKATAGDDLSRFKVFLERQIVELPQLIIKSEGHSDDLEKAYIDVVTWLLETVSSGHLEGFKNFVKKQLRKLLRDTAREGDAFAGIQEAILEMVEAKVERESKTLSEEKVRNTYSVPPLYDICSDVLYDLYFSVWKGMLEESKEIPTGSEGLCQRIHNTLNALDSYYCLEGESGNNGLHYKIPLLLMLDHKNLENIPPGSIVTGRCLGMWVKILKIKIKQGSLTGEELYRHLDSVLTTNRSGQCRGSICGIRRSYRADYNIFNPGVYSDQVDLALDDMHSILKTICELRSYYSARCFFSNFVEHVWQNAMPALCDERFADAELKGNPWTENHLDRHLLKSCLCFGFNLYSYLESCKARLTYDHHHDYKGKKTSWIKRDPIEHLWEKLANYHPRFYVYKYQHYSLANLYARCIRLNTHVHVYVDVDGDYRVSPEREDECKGHERKEGSQPGTAEPVSASASASRELSYLDGRLIDRITLAQTSPTECCPPLIFTLLEAHSLFYRYLHETICQINLTDSKIIPLKNTLEECLARQDFPAYLRHLYDYCYPRNESAIASILLKAKRSSFAASVLETCSSEGKEPETVIACRFKMTLKTKLNEWLGTKEQVSLQLLLKGLSKCAFQREVTELVVKPLQAPVPSAPETPVSALGGKKSETMGWVSRHVPPPSYNPALQSSSEAAGASAPEMPDPDLVAKKSAATGSGVSSYDRLPSYNPALQSSSDDGADGAEETKGGESSSGLSATATSRSMGDTASETTQVAVAVPLSSSEASALSVLSTGGGNNTSLPIARAVAAPPIATATGPF